MSLKAFQSTFNPTVSFIWPEPGTHLRHPDAPYKEVWVTNLPPETSETDVRDIFSAMGPLATTHVILDGKAQTLAHVCFSSPESGIKALCKLNEYAVEDRRINVSTYIDDAPNRRRLGGQSTVFLAGLPLPLSAKELFDFVRGFGTIVSIKLLKGDDFDRTQQACVEFVEDRDAKRAIWHLHLSRPLGPRNVISALPWVRRSDSDHDRLSLQVYMSPIKESMNSGRLLSMMNHFGVSRTTIKHIEWPARKIVKNKDPCSSQDEISIPSHVFIEFKDSDSARSAIYAMNNKVYMRSKLFVEPRRSKIKVTQSVVTFNEATSMEGYNTCAGGYIEVLRPWGREHAYAEPPIMKQDPRLWPLGFASPPRFRNAQTMHMDSRMGLRQLGQAFARPYIPFVPSHPGFFTGTPAAMMGMFLAQHRSQPFPIPWLQAQPNSQAQPPRFANKIPQVLPDLQIQHPNNAAGPTYAPLVEPMTKVDIASLILRDPHRHSSNPSLNTDDAFDVTSMTQTWVSESAPPPPYNIEVVDL